MRLQNLCVFGLAAIIVAGCGPSKPDTTASATSAATTGSAVARTGSAATGSPTPSQPAAAIELPETLKNDAYDFYGLANAKPINFEVETTSDQQIRTGIQTFTLKEVKNGQATYEAERTGGLEDLLGTDTLSLRNDGIYDVKNTKATIDGDRLELPSGLTSGKTWTSHEKMKQDTGSIDLTVKCTVHGTQKFTTKAGSREGLYITADGSGTVNGQKTKIAYQIWAVKGQGELKMILTMTPDKGKTQTVTIQEAK